MTASARRHRRRVSMVSLHVALAGALLLSACSDDDDDAVPETTTSAPPTTAAAETTTTTVAAAPGFVFGYLSPGAGLTDELAVAQQTALELAVQEINDAGGVLGAPAASVEVSQAPGVPIGDSATELFDQGATVLVGPVGSNDAFALRPLLEEQNRVACSASATAPGITADQKPVRLFRTPVTDDVTVAYVSERIAAARDALDPPLDRPFRVTIVARDDDYGLRLGGGLSAALTGRGVEVQVVNYNSRRVIFDQEASVVPGTNPDLTVLVSLEEAPRLLDSLIPAGIPADKLAGLDGTFTPRLAEQTFPTDPAQLDGFLMLGATGDRAFTNDLLASENQAQIVYGAQMRDCAILLALAATAANTVASDGILSQMQAVSEGGRTCTTYADCVRLLEAGEDIDFDGASGGIIFDDNGDASTSRFTTGSFENGAYVERNATDIDLEEYRQNQAFQQSLQVVRLQQALKALGFYDGPLDGIYDQEVADAVKLLQIALGLEPTGVYDAATDEAFRARYGSATEALGAATAEMQLILADLGFYDGPIDGRYSQATIDAIKAWQVSIGVPPTGIVDVSTLRAVYAQGQATPPTTVAPPPTTATTAPPAPTTTIAPPDPGLPTMFEVLSADPDFSELVKLLTAAGFDEDFEQLQTFTLFAPTNDALGEIPQETLDQIAADPSLLANVLAYHLVQPPLLAAQLSTGQLISVLGAPLDIVSGATVTVNGIAVVKPDLLASNGIIHGIEGVLLPPEQ